MCELCMCPYFQVSALTSFNYTSTGDTYPHCHANTPTMMTTNNSTIPPATPPAMAAVLLPLDDSLSVLAPGDGLTLAVLVAVAVVVMVTVEQYNIQ